MRVSSTCEYGRLQLEASTWALHSRVAKIATGVLGLRAPGAAPPARGRAPREPVSAAAQGLVRLPVWRARVVLALLVAAFAVLAARSVYLQAMKTGFLQEKGDARYSRVIEMPATRGRILDRNGDALAVSTPVKSVWAIPADAPVARAERRKLAALLGVSLRELERKLADTSRDFVYLKRQVVARDRGRHRAARPEWASTITREYRRYYPAAK